MKITSIKTAATVGHGMHLWVRVSTDAGIVGTGECVHGGKQAIAIIQYLGEKLVGRDPFAVDFLENQLLLENLRLRIGRTAIIDHNLMASCRIDKVGVLAQRTRKTFGHHLAQWIERVEE